MEREAEKDPINDGGPAFPMPGHNYVATNGRTMATMPRFGLTMRDYFAGQALIGLVSGITQVQSAVERVESPSGMTKIENTRIIVNMPRDCAQIAYTYADAMISESERS